MTLYDLANSMTVQGDIKINVYDSERSENPIEIVLFTDDLEYSLSRATDMLKEKLGITDDDESDFCDSDSDSMLEDMEVIFISVDGKYLAIDVQED